jgi:DNA-binding XRE family transcriptional regulator
MNEVGNMTVQFITTETGERLAVIPEAEYRVLVEAAEDREDVGAVRAFDAALARGDEELVPAQFANRILDGENKVRVWREYRGLQVKTLAEETGLAASYISQIETGVRAGTVESYKKIAAALKVGLDDIV